jgi:membrane peptidoglycan carboxypeptidase
MQIQVLIIRLFIAVFIDLVAVIGVAYVWLPDTSLLVEGTTLERRLHADKPFTFKAGPENKDYIRLSQISPFLRSAVMTLEDARFYEHRGVDIFEIFNAVDARVTEGGRLRGASTLTQQLAKNLYLSPERTFRRKIEEALIAIKLENTLSKSKILELYLNSVEWGRGLLGIKQAAAFYFKKHPKDLSPKEAVFLAAILPNPTYFGRVRSDRGPSVHIRRQMGRALQRLYEQGLISLEEFQEALQEPMEYR